MVESRLINTAPQQDHVSHGPGSAKQNITKQNKTKPTARVELAAFRSHSMRKSLTLYPIELGGRCVTCHDEPLSRVRPPHLSTLLTHTPTLQPGQ